ncbi:MAG: type II secretion system protein GspD [Roseateles depolymerans]|uniref:Type II secretion system protein GspD n=1 Tax=Roseateles depolymerans TaxID=76731 RepID=A0A2W5DV76_9BURK|nr:MAG: type II secretion system protein GspD [Roseateles depolymerans]
MSMNPRCTATALAVLMALGPAQAQPAPSTATTRAKPALKSSTPVTLNFVNADIEAVTRAIGVMLDRQIIIDPRVKGSITVYSEQPVPVREAYLTYLAALRGLGFTVVETAGFLKVLPEPDAKLQAGSVAVESTNARGDQILTQIFRIQHENANNLVAVLRPLISPNNTINANPGNNSLVITDYADNLQRIAKIIAAMDTPGSSDIEIVPLKYAVAADLAPLVQKLADGGSANAAAAVPGQASTAVNVLVDPRSNGLILRASNPARLASVRSMVDKLDQPSGDAGTNIRVVYLKNADAAKLATVLRAAFGSAGGSSSGSSGSSSPGTQSLTGASSNQTNNSNSSSNSSSGLSQAATTPVAQSANPSTGGFVQADPATNSLIITAAEPLYRQVRQVIEQLDARRAQVYIESMIVKIDNSKAAQFGVQWQNMFGSSGSSSITGAGTNFGTGLANIINGTAAVANGTSGVTTALANGSAPTGLNIGVLKKFGSFYTLGAMANFFESQSGSNVLSTPNLVALDNEEAKIVIGQNVPFVTGSYTNTGTTSSGTVNPFTTVDRKDVGLTLRIKSQIGEGGSVRMVVYQENSSVLSTSTNGPTLDKSSIETSVVVDDGDIIVLGGLLKDEYSDGDDGVPGLSKIPLIGNLFSSQNRKRVKTNLMVFLRPIVLRNADSSNQLSMDRYESIRAAQQQAQPAKNIILPQTGAPVLPEAKQPAPKAETPASAASAASAPVQP